MRHDVLFYTQLHWSSLPRAQLWLPGQCCRPDAGRDGEPSAGLHGALKAVKRECLGDEGAFLAATCSTSRFLRTSGGDELMAREAEWNYYVNDCACMPTKQRARAPAPHAE